MLIERIAKTRRIPSRTLQSIRLGVVICSGIGLFAVSEADYGGEPATAPVEALRAEAVGFLYGKDREKDYLRAKQLFEKAAEAGDAEATFYLGYIYNDGLGVSKDPTIARNWFERAAKRGSVGGMINYGIFLVRGRGGNFDPAQGLEWLEKARATGCMDAVFVLSDVYMNGEADANRTPDYGKVNELLLPLAEKGNPKAQNVIGVLYRDGRIGAADEATAKRWFEKAAMQGDAKACTNLGQFDYRTPGPAQIEALAWLEVGKRRGDVVAAALLNEYLPGDDSRWNAINQRASEMIAKIQSAGAAH